MNNPTFIPVQFKTVDENQLNQRLDNFLMAECRALPKNRIYQMIRKGEVRVNKGRASPTYRLQIGDEVRIPPLKLKISSLREPTKKELKDLKTLILKETQDFIVINKPSGLSVHRGSGVDLGLIELLKAKRKAPFLALVHRLDRETSGLLLIAKNRPTLLSLQALFLQASTAPTMDFAGSEKAIVKEYLLLVQGKPAKGSFTVTLSLDTQHRNKKGERVVVVSNNGVPAITHFEVQDSYLHESLGKLTLLKAQLLTGRTHQIRVHSAAIGHPIIGDSRYGTPLLTLPALPVTPSKNHGDMGNIGSNGLNRLFLHASLLKFTLNQQNYLLTAPLPKELNHWLNRMTKVNF